MKTQRELTADWRESLDRIDARAREVASGLSESQLNWNPPDGGWSAGQVLEHMLVTNELYLERIRSCLADPRAPMRRTKEARWRPTLAGRFLAYALRGPRKVRAPRAFQPGPAPRPRVLEAFLRSQREVATEVERSSSIDLRRAKTTSPVSGLIPVNLGDCFTTLVLHSERHLAQIDRLQNRQGFPKPGPAVA